MDISKNITISIHSSSTPKHRRVSVEFDFINDKKEKEIELKMYLIDGKIDKNNLTSKNANIKLLNLCSDFMEKLSIQQFD